MPIDVFLELVAAMQSDQLLTVVIPAYNEEASIRALVSSLKSVLDDQIYAWNILFVDDGSSDGTLKSIREMNDSDNRIRCISLSRNFGKEIAIAAGLRHAEGAAVLIMDADLQHPAEMIPAFLARWREGHKVVMGVRTSQNHTTLLRAQYSRMFHGLFRRLSRLKLTSGAVDFILLDRRAVDAFNRIGERTRFSKGLYSWIGFSVGYVPFEAANRYGGNSHWNFFKLAQFALDGIFSFSTLPLKIWSYIGAFISLFALGCSLYFVLKTLFFQADVPGFPSLIVSIMFLAGVQLISLGVLGEYIARIYEETKARPLYVVGEEIGTTPRTSADD